MPRRSRMGGTGPPKAADALVALQQLVAEATAAPAQTIDPDALATQIHRYRSAAQTGITQTAARSDAVTRKHNALAAD
jgi:transposase